MKKNNCLVINGVEIELTAELANALLTLARGANGNIGNEVQPLAEKATKSRNSTKAQPKADKAQSKQANDEVVHTDATCKWVRQGAKVAYATSDGQYVSLSATRKALNRRLREAGATCGKATDGSNLKLTVGKDSKGNAIVSTAYVFENAAKAKAFVEAIPAVVSVAEIDAHYARKADKKARKNA